jgi:hypothetical protein
MSVEVNANTDEIVYDRGDDQTITFTVSKADGSVQDITSWSFKFTVKESVDDAIADAKFQKATGGSGIALTTPLSGILDVTIAANDTVALAGNYVYDLQGTDGSGNIRTVALARFRVRKNVTTVGVAGNPSSPLTPFPGAVSIAGYLYLLDATTAQWTAIRVNNGFLELSDNQSATIPFIPTFS